jgi:hypothetical protein
MCALGPEFELEFFFMEKKKTVIMEIRGRSCKDSHYGNQRTIVQAGGSLAG